MLAALILAVALAMDAFAVALTQGARFRPGPRHALLIALTFGLFQGGMPLIGWAGGELAYTLVSQWDHWIAFGLLTVLGIQMLRGGDNDAVARPLTGGALLTAGIATSIDALAAGITLPTLDFDPLAACALIAGVTAALSAIGVLAGRFAGERLGDLAEKAGGVLLIGLGAKILAEHTIWL